MKRRTVDFTEDEWRAYRRGDMGFAQAVRNFLEWNPDVEAEDLYNELHRLVDPVTVPPDSDEPTTSERRAATEEFRQRLYDLWHDGKRTADIAQALDRTPAQISAEVSNMRRAGWEMPYRRSDFVLNAAVAAVGDRERRASAATHETPERS